MIVLDIILDHVWKESVALIPMLAYIQIWDLVCLGSTSGKDDTNLAYRLVHLCDTKGPFRNGLITWHQKEELTLLHAINQLQGCKTI